MVAASWIMAEYMKLPANGPSQFIPLLLFAVGLAFAILRYHHNLPGAQPFKEYFSEGFKMFIIVTLLMVIYTFAYHKFNPQVIDDFLRENNALLLKEGTRTPEEIAKFDKDFRSSFMPSLIAFTTIKFLVMGSLISLVFAAFLSSKRKSEMSPARP